MTERLHRRQGRLVAIGGADQGTCQRHGYGADMNGQSDHGIFDYCGSPVRSSTVLLPSEGDYARAHLETAQAIGASIFASQS